MSFFKLLFFVALCIVRPVVSIEVMLEFSGRPSDFNSSQVVLLVDAVIAAYNPKQGGRKKKKKQLRSLTTVDVDTSDVASLTHEEAATQPFTLLAQITCDGCKRGNLFNAKNPSARFGVDSFIFRLNDIIINSGGDFSSIESLIAVQQIEDVTCPAAQDESLLETSLQVILDSYNEPSPEELEEIGEALLETHNFLNTVSPTSRRCDKSFRNVKKVRYADSDHDLPENHRRTEAQVESHEASGSNSGLRNVKPRQLMMDRSKLSKPFSYSFTTQWSCHGTCPRGASLLDNDAGRRILEGKSAAQHDIARVLARGKKLKCKCPVDADSFGPVPHNEFVATFRKTLKALQEQGKLSSFADVIDITE